MAESRISRMGFWKRAVVGGLTALIMYTSAGCGAAVSGPALRVEEDYARAPRAVPEVVIGDPVDAAFQRLKEADEHGLQVAEEAERMAKAVEEYCKLVKYRDRKVCGE